MLRLIATFILCLWSTSATAQNCEEIKFARGAYSGEVSGQVTDGEFLCFTFGSGNGQTARLQIFGSDNVCVTVVGVADCQVDVSFRTRRQTYELTLFQLFPSPRLENYTLRLTIR